MVVFFFFFKGNTSINLSMYRKIIPHITTAVWLAQLVVCWASVEEVAGSNQRRYGEKKMSVGSALDYKARDRWLNSYKGHFKVRL